MTPTRRRRAHSMLLAIAAIGLLLATACFAAHAADESSKPRRVAAATATATARDAASQAPASTLVDAAGLRERIALLKARVDLPTTERDLALDQLDAALARTESAGAARSATDAYATAMADAPQTIASLDAQASSAASSDERTTDAASALDGDPVRSQLRLAALQAKAVTMRSRQRQLQENLQALTARPSDARNELVALRGDLDRVETTVPANASPLVAEASRLRIDAARDDLAARIERTEQELLSLPTRESIVSAQLAIATQQLARGDAVIDTLQRRIDAQRAAASANRVTQAQAALQDVASQPQALRVFAKKTLDARKAAVALNGQLAATVAMQDVLRSAIDKVRASRRSAEKILDIGRIGDEYARLLRSLEKSLPSRATLDQHIATRDATLIDARASELRTEQQLSEFDDVSAAARRLLADARLQPSSSALATANALVDARVAALADLQTVDKQWGDALSETAALDAELLQGSEQLRTLFDQRLVWLPSAAPLGTEWIGQLADGARWLVLADHWREIPGAALSGLRAGWLTLLLLAGILAALLINLGRLKRALERLAAPVGHRGDSFRVTLGAFATSIALALPLPIAVFTIGWLLQASAAPSALAQGLARGLMNAGIVLFMLGVFWAMCRRQGLFIVHFGWDADGVRRLARALRLLALAIAPAALVAGVANTVGSQTLVEGWGRLAFMIGSLALALFMYRVFRPRDGALTAGLDRDKWIWRTRHIWFWGLVAIPLVLALVAASGYYATAQEVQRRLFSSGWIVLATIIGFRIAMRGVLVAGRRAAYEQADARHEKARADAQAAAAEGGGAVDAAPPGIDESEIDVVSVSQQTRALLRAVAVVVLALLLWGIWRSLLPALGVFDDVVLWSHVVSSPSGDSVGAVTLGDLMLSVLLLSVTAVAARNLPGFLEIAVLQRFSIDSGTRYAVGTIARYAILAIGLVVTFNRIGADWSRLQWIVAALGVGLGFGLQEIVANFISGIIILFERPVRVGDLVSIGTTTGTVTRIKIRAITITDFDNFEVLVPNKSFITETVQNWTLTSAVTRLLIKIGIAYGTDVDRAQRLMLDAVSANPQVLDSPAPSVMFTGFGDSALEFEIRAFVARIDQRLQTQNDIHMALNAALAKAGIQIPFPQRDVHLKQPPAQIVPDASPETGTG